jgi:hypothetical protein
MQGKLMTLNEKLDTVMKTIELEKLGKFEEAERVHTQIPLPPYLAKFYKDYLGLDVLLQGGWNLAEVEAEYGNDWLVR